MDEKAWIKKLQDEGYSDVRTCPIPPNLDLPEHTHNEHTVHVIVSGDLIITENGTSKTYKPGDVVEFPAGTTHKARGSIDSGRMINGVKK